jgi:adenylate cyclase
MTDSHSSSARIALAERKLTLFNVDLTGFTRTAQATRALDLAEFIDRYYRLCSEHVARHHGRVVKFMGDACFAVFPEEHCQDAVQCAIELRKAIGSLEGLGGRPPSAGANVHLAIVAEGELGAENDRRYDVIGEGVNHLFRMGGGAGIRISEPVYRSLANDRRGPWQKQKPPATYVLET